MARTNARRLSRPVGSRGERARHRRTLFGPRGALAALALAAVGAVGARVGGADPLGSPLDTTFDATSLDRSAPRTLASPGEAPARPADLSLVFYDPQGALPRGFEKFAAEVQTVFRTLGVEASWRVGGTFGGAPLPEVPVILLLRDPYRARDESRVMGLVRRDQQPQRAVWLFMEGVRYALGYSQNGEIDYEGDVARALARVAAHEIVHAVAPDEPHASVGLMRHALDKRFLLGERATVDARCARTFRTRLSAEWHQLLVRAPLPSTFSLPVP